MGKVSGAGEEEGGGRVGRTIAVTAARKKKEKCDFSIRINFFFREGLEHNKTIFHFFNFFYFSFSFFFFRQKKKMVIHTIIIVFHEKKTREGKGEVKRGYNIYNI